MKLALALALVLYSVMPAAAHHDLLHTTASGMAAGTGGVTALIPANTASQTAAWQSSGGSSQTHLGFTDSLHWDPRRWKLHFYGGDHNAVMAHVELSFATTTTAAWASVALPSPPNGFGSLHGYDRTAINPYTGNHYVNAVDSSDIYVSTDGGATFPTTLTGGTPSCSSNGARYIEYWPTLGTQGSLVRIFGCSVGNVYTYDLATGGPWVQRGGPGLLMGGIQGFIAYNSFCDCVVGGGGEGSANYIKLTRSGSTVTVTQMAAAPMGLGNHEVTFVPDSISSDFVILCGRGCSGNNGMWRLDPAGTGTWTQITATTPALLQSSAGTNDSALRACSPVPYGVILCILMDEGSPSSHRTVLYKHTATPTIPFTIPTRANEASAYSLFGWTAPSAVNHPNLTGVSIFMPPDIHDITEGDDFWTTLWAYWRSSTTQISDGTVQGYRLRYNEYQKYYYSGHRSCTQDSDGAGDAESLCDDAAFGHDHWYGWGLIDYYWVTLDWPARTEAIRLGETLDAYFRGEGSSGNYPVPTDNYAPHGTVRHARQLIFACKLYEMTGSSSHLALCNAQLDVWMSMTRPGDGTIWRAATGSSLSMVYMTDFENVTSSTCSECNYAAGDRIQSTFHVAIYNEGLGEFYRIRCPTDTTRCPAIRQRLIDMAAWALVYGLHTTAGTGPGGNGYQYTGSYIGVVQGQPYDRDIGLDGVSTSCSSGQTHELVNTLVRGYKLTGTSSYLTRAKLHWIRANGQNFPSCTARTVADNVIHHWADQGFDSGLDNWYFDSNKGELRSIYLLFENGGAPTVESGTSAPPAAPTGFTISSP